MVENFNPRPREGSDCWVSVQEIHNRNFNPRPREGSDVLVFGSLAIKRIISIHAPVKGATHGARGQRVGRPDFNPRPREGSDEAYTL